MIWNNTVTCDRQTTRKIINKEIVRECLSAIEPGHIDRAISPFQANGPASPPSLDGCSHQDFFQIRE